MPNTHSDCQERHVLVINDGKRRAIALEAAAYSIGRDPSNAIVINADTMSRQHAILLRVPVPGKHRYRYRVIDGNFEGKPSANGVFSNGKKISTCDLANGDVIRFGQTIEASYLKVSMGEEEFSHYLEGISYQRIKSEMVNAKETLVANGLMEEELRTEIVTTVATMPVQVKSISQNRSASPLTETIHEAIAVGHDSVPWKAIIPGALLTVSGIAGLWILVSQSRLAQSSAETRYPAPAIQPSSK
jgi:pSer/pThr/pTyr-binding forkhead associated (FHA) protein